MAFPGSNAPAGGGNVTVDFRTVANGGGPLVTIDPLGVGITISTYNGAGSGNINASTTWKTLLANLAPAHCRIPFRWNNGNPGSSAGGAQTSGDADTYVGNIKAIGAIPFVVYGGDTSDNGGITGANGAAFVHHYNDAGGQNNGPVKYWVVGNEPDVSGGTGPYISGLPAILSAMHGADSTVKLSAPAAGFWDTSLLSAVAGSNLDIFSYHAYDGDNNDGSGFPTDPQYFTHLHTDLPGMKGGVMYGVEEVNWSPNYNTAHNQTAFYDWHNTCYIADVAGQALAAGAHFTQYADSNAALSLMNDGTSNQAQVGSFGTTFPAYWGVGIWTGMNNQFKRWGTFMVPTTTTFSQGQVTVFGCDNGKVVIVNKTASTQALTIHLGGTTSGTYQVWKSQATNPTGPIIQDVASSPYSGSAISYTIPAQTAISLEVTDSGTPAGLTIQNNFEGGTVFATMTPGGTGNTGGVSGTPFDSVYQGTACIVCFSNSTAAHGSISATCTTGTISDAAFFSWAAALNGPLATVYGRAYLYFTGLPSTQDSVIEFHSPSGAFAGGIQVDTTGHIHIQDGAFGVKAAFTNAIPTNTWVRVEWEMVAGNTGTGTLIVNYYATKDSGTVTETHTDTTGPYGGGAGSGVQQIDFGWCNAHASQSTLYIDDVLVTTVGFPGPVTSTPTVAANNAEGGTNGTTVTTANSGGTSGTAWSAVNIGTSTTSAFSNTQVAHGLMAYKFQTGATSAAVTNQWSSAVVGTQTTLYGRAYVYLTGSPITDCNIAQFAGGSAVFGGGIMIASSRQLRIQNAAFGETSGGPTIPINQWVRLEWKIVCGSAGSASATVNYYASADSTTITNTQTDAAGGYGSAGSINQVNFGYNAAAINHPAMYMDSLAIANSGFLGPDQSGVTNALIQGIAAQMSAAAGTGSNAANTSVPGVAAQISATGGVGFAGSIVNAVISTAHTGSNAAWLKVTGAGNVTLRPNTNKYIPVTPGDNVTVTVYGQPTSPGMTFNAAIDWYNSSKVFISTSNGTGVNPPPWTWTQATVTATAPAGAAFAAYGPTLSSTTTGFQMGVDDVVITGADTGPIADGTFETGIGDWNSNQTLVLGSQAASIGVQGGIGSVAVVSHPDLRTPLHLGGTIRTVDKFDGTLVEWTMIEVDVTLGQFNDETFAATITAGGSPLDLTSYEVDCFLKPGSGIPDNSPGVVKMSTITGEVTKLTQSGGTLGMISVGISNVYLTGAATPTFYRIDLVDGSNRRNTAMYGKVTITDL